MRRYLALLAAMVAVCFATAATAQTSCPAPSIVQIGGTNPSCAGQPVTLDAGGGWVTYQWSNGGTTRIITDAPGSTTSYTVTVTDANGCSVTSTPQTVTVTTAAQPVISAPSTMCAGGTVNASASNSSYAQYQWTVQGGVIEGLSVTPNVTVRATSPAPVQLTVNVTDFNGCVSSNSKTITVTGNMPVIQPPPSLCEGTADIAQETWITSNIQWTAVNGDVFGNTHTSFVHFRPTSLNPVTLTVTGNNSSGCPVKATAVINVTPAPAPPVIHIDQSPLCPGSPDFASIDGSYGTITWSIVNGTITSGTSQPSVSFLSNANGSPVTLTVRVTSSSSGCPVTTSTSIPVRSIAPPAIHVDSIPLCAGAPDFAWVDPPAAGVWQSIQWSIVNGSITYGANMPSFNFTSDANGQPVTLTVNLTDSFGCKTSNSVSIPVRSIAPPAIHVDNVPLCAGAPDFAWVDPPAAGIWQSIQWSIVNGSITYGANMPSFNFTSDPNGQPVTLTVNLTDSFGCKTSNSVSIPARTITPPAIHVDNMSICAGAPDFAFVDPPAAGSWQAVQWSIVNGTITYGANMPSVNFTADSSGQPVTLTATLTDSSYCRTTAGVSIPVHAVPPPAITADHDAMCPNGSNYAWIAPPAAGGEWSNIQWTIANGTIDPPSPYVTGPQTTIFFNADASGQPVTITATVTDNYSCHATSSKTMSASALTGPVIHLSQNPICAGNPYDQAFAWIDAPTPPNGYSNVQWSITNGTIGYTPQYGIYFQPNASGPVTINVTVSDYNGCSTTSSVTAPVIFTAPPVITLDHPTICYGGHGHASIASSASYTNIAWSVYYGNYTVAPDGLSVDFTSDWSGTGPNVSVQVTTDTGCITSAYVTLPQTQIASPEISAPASICAGAQGTIAITNASSYSTYRWIVNNATIVGADDGPSIQFLANGGGNVAFHVDVNDAGSCYAVGYGSIALNPASATITAGGPTTFCTGGSVTLTANSGASYLWSNGATTQSIAVNQSGSYSVTVTAGNGCAVTSAPTNVTVNPLPAATITASGPTTLCGGGSVTLTAPAGASYLWSNGATTQAITVSTGGNYSVTVTGTGGCSVTSAPVAVVTRPAPNYAPVIRTPQYICPDGTQTFTLWDASPYTSFSWSVTNGTIVGSASGSSVSIRAGASGEVTVAISAVDTAGCTLSWTTNVPIRMPEATLSLPEAVCFGGTWYGLGVFESSNETYLWSVTGPATLHESVTGPQNLIEFTGPGDVTVSFTITAASGCSRTFTTSTHAYDKPAVSIQTPPATCSATSNTATASGSGLTTYFWSITGGTIVGSSYGPSVTYNLTAPTATLQLSASDAHCSGSASVVVTNGDVAPAVSISGTTFLCPGTTTVLTAPANQGAYLWSTGATTRSITVDQAGDYTVQVTSPQGCTKTSSPVHITAETASRPNIVFSAPLCDTTQYFTTTISNAAQFQNVFTYSNAAFISRSGNTTTWFKNGWGNESIWVEAHGYTSSCELVTRIDPIPATPAPDATISGPVRVCGMAEYVTSAVPDAGPGATYTWNISGNAEIITLPSDRNRYWISWKPHNFGSNVSLDVTVTSAGGCTRQSTKSIPVDIIPDYHVTINAPVCENAVGTASAPYIPGAVYFWGGSGVQWVGGGGTNTTTFMAGPANGNGGSIYVDIALPGGCHYYNTAYFSPQAAPSAVVTASGPLTFCAGGSVTLTAASASSYLWSNGATTQSINATATGNYSVTVTNAAGCSSTSAPKSVFVTPTPATPVITAGGPTTFCAGGSVTLSAPSGYGYSWSNGATTQSINVTSAGSYTVTVTNGNGCSATSTPTSVTVNAAPATPVVTAGGPTTFCAGGSVTLTAPAASSYLWSNGATTQAINATTSGSYSVTVTNASGCSATSTPTSVTVNAAPATPVITAGGQTTFCAGGSVTLTAPASTSYLWSNGATTQAINATTSGSYSVTVTNASGCSATSTPTSVTVNAAPATPVITAGGQTTFCAGGSVTLTVPASTSYLWSNGATTQAINVTISGAYSVTVTNASGCSATSTATSVTVNAAPATPVITAGGPTTFCAGGSVTLSAPASTSYLWSNGATTQAINVTTSGSYSVTVTNASGCSATSAATSVTVNANPSTPVITAGGPTTFCAGGSVTLTAPAAASYLWSNGATTQAINVTTSGSYSVTVTNASGCSATSSATAVTADANPSTPIITSGGPTTFCAGGSVTLTAPASTSYLWSNAATTQAINVTTSGSYSVTVTNTSGCSATSSATAVTVDANPSTPIITSGGPTTFCAGGSVTLTAPASTSYLWSNGATTQAINVTTSGSYSVIVTNASGCSASSAATTVTVDANPSTPVITAGGPTTFCAGGSVTLTAPSSSAYLWSNGATTQAINVTTSGSYSVTVTNASGCSATSAPTSVTANPLPDATISVTGSPILCDGANVTLTAPAGYNYSWSNGATTRAITVSEPGSYSVTVTSDAGCSTTSAPVVVTNDPTAVTISGGAPIICPGASVHLTSAVTNGSATAYQWYGFGGQPIAGETSPTLDVTPSMNGYYFVRITSANGCSVRSNVYVYNIDTPSATINAGGPTTFCAGGSVTLTANAGASYLWSNGATTPSINVTTSGSYSVTVTTANSCSATSAPTSVTVNANPSTPAITAGGPTTFCAGGSVTLTAPASSSYSWSNGATTQSINVTTSGSYSVTVTNASGCSATSAATTVTVNATPTIPVITAGGATTFCAGGSVTLTAPASTSYLWSNGATTQAINVTTSGSYSVTVTNASGCSATSAVTTVTVNANPATPVITAGGATTFCAGGSVTLTAPASNSYLWSNGATTQAINVTTSGSYSVTVTNASGCSATSATTTVTVNATPTTPVINAGGATTFCAGGSVTLTAPASSSYLWSNGATTQAINVTTSGSYSVTVTNASGCSATSAATTVTVDAAPTIPVITAGGPTTFCAGGSVTLTAPASSSYLWSNGATTQAINVTTSGSYSVTVTNASGCSATSTATTVTVNAAPTTPVITAGGATTFCAGGSVTLTAPASSSYLWSNGATTQAINVTTSGSYSVTVTNASGCTATSAATTVTVNAAPTTPVITAGGATTFCAGGSVTLTAPASSSYLWSNGATTQAINVTTSGSYSVTVTNASGCSATSAATTVTVNAAPTNPVITAGGPTTFCAGGSVTLTAPASSSYLWSNGATTQSINVTTSGSYSVTVTNASGCSATSAATTVTVNAAPTTPVITAGGPTTFCAGGSVTLTAPAGYTYSWSNGATTQAINVTTSGSYSVTVTNASGCSATSTATTVTVNAKPATPVINAGGPTTFCAGGSVTLTAPAGFTYSWSNGATTQSINVTTSGSYSVTVTNASGCSATSAPTTVTVNAKPATPVITASGSTAICPGSGVTLTAPAGFTYLWSTGATSQSINATSAGNYSVTVTNASGCSTASAATAVTMKTTTSITQPANKTIARNATTSFTVVASGTNLTYQWYEGNAGVTTTPRGTLSTQSVGPYTRKGSFPFWVRVTGDCGVVSSTTITLTVN